MHPLLQKVPIESKSLLFRPEKMCASLVFLVSAVFGSSALWVEFIISPFGMFVGTATLTCCFSAQGEFSVR